MLKKILSYVLLVAVLVLLVLYAIKNWNQLNVAVSGLRIFPIVLLLFATFILVLVNTVNYMQFYLSLGLKLGWKESFRLVAVSSLLNLVLPFKGGSVAQAVMVKKSYGFDYTRSVVMNLVLYQLGLLVLAGVSVANLLVLRQVLGLNIIGFQGILIFFLLFFVSMILLLLVPSFKVKFASERLNRIMEGFSDGWDMIRSDWNRIMRLLLLSLASMGIMVLQTLFAYQAVNVDVSVFQSLFVSSWGFLSNLVNLTPGNIGIQESVLAASGALLEINPTDGLVSAVLIRLSWLVSLLVVLLFVGLKRNVIEGEKSQ